MIAALLLGLLAAGATSPTVGQRETAVLVLIVPREGAPQVSPSVLLDEVSRALEDRTRLEVIPPDRIGVHEGELDRCPIDGLYTCWARAMRGTTSSGPRLALIAVERPEGIALVVMDLASARSIIERETDPEALESSLYRKAFRPEPVALEDPSTLGARVADVLEPGLRSLDLWFENGRLVLAAPPDQVVTIDGTPVATTRAGETELEGIAAGSHLVAVGAGFERSVSVPTGGLVRVDVPVRPDPSVLRTATIWTGVAVAVAGVAVTGWSISAGRADRYGCLTTGGGCPDGPGVGFGAVPESGAVGPEAVERSALPAASVGAGLLAAGVVWSLGTLLFHDEHEDPWWSLVSGLLGGGIVLGTTAVVLR